MSSLLANDADRWLEHIHVKIGNAAARLENRSENFLKQLQNGEKKLKRKLARKDSVAAEKLFGDVARRFDSLKSDLEAGTSEQAVYSSYLDSVKTALNFLSTNNDLLPNSVTTMNTLKSAMQSLDGVDAQLAKVTFINNYVRQRRQFLKDRLNASFLSTTYKKYSQQIYYYNEQFKSWKAALEDPSKMEQKILKVIRELPGFQEFFRKNSILASLFRIPGNDVANANFQGLQSRSNVLSLLQERISAAGPNATNMLQQQVQSAQAELGKLKDKLNEFGDLGDEQGDFPDFKSNTEKAKTFLDRIEFGTNLQSQRSSNYFPTTTDVGLSIGYKLNGKSIVGIGASFKMGWGKDIRNISITSQGAGIRTFLDYKLRGSFFATGGLEYNYQQPINTIGVLHNIKNWQQSGLIGVSKIVDLKSKFFKKTKLQLLWDILSYQQQPQGQPVKFRVGYNF